MIDTLPDLLQMKKLLIISLLLLSLAYGQQNRWQFEHFNTEDGLAHIAVNTIYQDSYGYLWFGTWNGLSRFDSYQFRNYSFDANDPQSLTHGTIYDIQESEEGQLWVATEGGLDHFIREEDRFHPYPGNCEVNMPCGGRFMAIEFDGENRLWASNWYYHRTGLYYWDKDSGGFQHALPLRAREILNMGRFWWVPGPKGLNMVEPETFDIYPAPEIFPVLEPLWDIEIYKLAKGPGDEVWIATEKGLFVFEQGKIRLNTAWPVKDITALLADSYGGLWMGTSHGLYYQAEREEQIRQIRHDPALSSSLSSNEINCLYEDRQGNLWIGTERGGLNKTQLAPNNWFRAFDTHDFKAAKNSLTVYAITKTRDKHQLWVGTNLGIYVFDANNHTLIRHLAAELPETEIRAVFEDRRGNIWVGGLYGNLVRFSAENRADFKFETLPKVHGSIRRITEDLQGNLWTGARQLLKFEAGERIKSVFERLPPGTPYSSLPYVWDFQFADSCHAWIACNQGIFLHHVCEDSTREVRYFRAQGHRESMAVFDIFLDKKEALWAGLWGGGLARMDLSTGQIKRFGRQNGLPGNHVYGILQDGQNQFWLSTDYGIARFNPREERFVTFTRVDGLMANEFDSGAFFEAEDGEMFFGGRNGFVRFRPWEIPVMLSPRQLEIRLTSLRISGEEWRAASALESLDSIAFYFAGNQVLEFSFSAFDFTHLGETRYKYRLLGFEENWSPATRTPQTRYTDLPPGLYTLEIMASDLEGFSPDQKKTIHLHIRPLLTQQGWFKIVSIAAAVVLLSLLVYIRTRRLNSRERTLWEYKAALAKQEALAAQFDHHFTFNSLNSIQRFVIEKENKQAIRYISRFGKLIRRVMHQARQNTITIEEELQTLELYLSLEQLRVRHPFTYDIRIDKHIDPFTTEIPTMLIQPYLENAIWHGLMPAERPGHIELTFERKGKYTFIQITDNGIGRKKSAELKARSSMNHESKGMALARERLESLHLQGGKRGSLKIHDLYDEEGKALGTRIELIIPVLA